MINVSLWDMIEKNFPEPGSERRLQGSSSASPGKEKRSAGDRKRDRRWREYQESLAAEAAQGAKGGIPAPSPQRANGGHHPGHATLGDFMEVAKQTQAKPRRLLLRPQQAPAGPSSDVDSAHRGRMPADQPAPAAVPFPPKGTWRAPVSASVGCPATFGQRFRILATLQQGNESMYSNTSGYVHMGLRLDWGKGITGQ